MTEIISRLYATRKAAEAAVESLVDRRFNPSLIFVVGPPPTQPVNDPDRAWALEALAAQLMKGWVLKSKARIYAEAALDSEEGKYQVGKSTTFTVLQLQNNLTSARSQEIRAQANYAEALVNLAQQEGGTIERHHLSLQVK